MKKTLLILLNVLIFSSYITAQQIPNGSFETWPTPSTGYEDPQGWASLNILNAFSGTPAGVTKATPGNGGSGFAMSVKTNSVTGDEGQDTLPGFAFSGTMNLLSGESSEGFPFPYRPATFNGYYKHTVSGLDTAIIVIALSKYNTQTNMRDSIGGTAFVSFTSATVFTPFSVPFIYTSSTLTPDTATIMVFSGSNPGSEIIVDDFTVSGVTGVSIPLLTNFSKAFPNPAKDELNLIKLPSSAGTVEIKDVTGRTIKNLNAASELKIDVSGYNAGIYHYSVKDDNGSLLYSDKFSVIK